MTAPTQQIQHAIKLTNPMKDMYPAFIFGNAQFGHHMVEPDSAAGLDVVICGAGPSLKENAHRIADGAQRWGCNSALIYLHDNGHQPTHGFCIDQTESMLHEWENPPAGVDYLVASTIHPKLTEHLLAKGCTLRWFHNFVGIENPEGFPIPTRMSNDETIMLNFEDWLYATLWAGTVRVGDGLNSVNRAIDVALFMGARKVIVLGADCALRTRSRAPADNTKPEYQRWLTEDATMHADGGHALASGATGIVLHGEIDGRYWATKPDMMISAVHLVRAKQKYGDRLELVGDTLPNALMDKDDAFLAKLPQLNQDGAIENVKPLTVPGVSLDHLIDQRCLVPQPLTPGPVPVP